jgi:hypothetical protein
MENNMKETLDEAAERYYGYRKSDMFSCFELDCKQEGFIEGAKWQQIRMYSEEEVRAAIIKASMSSTDNFIKICDEIIEQFKKK